MSIAAYAKANNIPAHRLYDARKKQKSNKQVSISAPAVEVQSIPDFVAVAVAPILPSLSLSLTTPLSCASMNRSQ